MQSLSHLHGRAVSSPPQPQLMRKWPSRRCQLKQAVLSLSLSLSLLHVFEYTYIDIFVRVVTEISATHSSIQVLGYMSSIVVFLHLSYFQH